jgi:ribulose-phosphate 3-epimerase
MEDVDFIMIMSVNPGFGGQKFIPNSLDRVRSLRKMIRDRGLETLIEIDGGVNEKTIKNISDAGVDIFVAGSAIFKSPDYNKTIAKFRELISG